MVQRFVENVSNFGNENKENTENQDKKMLKEIDTNAKKLKNKEKDSLKNRCSMSVEDLELEILENEYEGYKKQKKMNEAEVLVEKSRKDKEKLKKVKGVKE